MCRRWTGHGFSKHPGLRCLLSVCWQEPGSSHPPLSTNPAHQPQVVSQECSTGPHSGLLQTSADLDPLHLLTSPSPCTGGEGSAHVWVRRPRVRWGESSLDITLALCFSNGSFYSLWGRVNVTALWGVN